MELAWATCQDLHISLSTPLQTKEADMVAIPLIPAFGIGGLRQEDYLKFNISLTYRKRPSLKIKQNKKKQKTQFLQNFIWFYRTILFYFILKAIFLSDMGLVFDGMVPSVFLFGDIRPSHLEPHVAMEQRVL